MPVYVVEITARNGHTLSAPIVAETADAAIADMEARHDIAHNDPDFTIVARQQSDPDGRSERLLIEAEIRQLDAEFYRPSPVKRRVRR